MFFNMNMRIYMLQQLLHGFLFYILKLLCQSSSRDKKKVLLTSILGYFWFRDQDFLSLRLPSILVSLS